MLQTALSNVTVALQAAKNGSSTKSASASQEIVFSVEHAALSITDVFGITDQRQKIIPSPGSLQHSLESKSGNFSVPAQKDIPNISFGNAEESNVPTQSKDQDVPANLSPPKMTADSTDFPGELQMCDPNSHTLTESIIGKKDSPSKLKVVSSRKRKESSISMSKNVKSAGALSKKAKTVAEDP